MVKTTNIADIEVDPDTGLAKGYKVTPERLAHLRTISPIGAASPNIGRPALYNNCMDLDAAIEEYFEELGEGERREVYDKKSQTFRETIVKNPPTIAGLTRHLGYSGMNALRELEESEASRRNGFSGVLKRARDRIDEVVSLGLLTGELNTVGCIFYAKNHLGYKDQQEQVHNTGIQVIISPGIVPAVESRVESPSITSAQPASMLTIDVSGLPDSVSAGSDEE